MHVDLIHESNVDHVLRGDGEGRRRKAFRVGIGNAADKQISYQTVVLGRKTKRQD
jgi:hypothetical protein